MNINWKSIRDYGIIGVIGFGLILGLYVSIPDFPYDAHAWELMLWGESSQWWSEMTWIGGFVILSISGLYLISWNLEIKSNKQEEAYLEAFRYIWPITVVSVAVHYSMFYFKWTDTESFFMKDSGGYLHGLFYLITFFLGILVFVEFMAYLSKVHGYMMELSKIRPLECDKDA